MIHYVFKTQVYYTFHVDSMCDVTFGPGGFSVESARCHEHYHCTVVDWQPHNTSMGPPVVPGMTPGTELVVHGAEGPHLCLKTRFGGSCTELAQKLHTCPFEMDGPDDLGYLCGCCETCTSACAERISC